MEAVSDPSQRINGVSDDARGVSLSLLEPHSHGAGRQRNSTHHPHAVLQLEALHADRIAQVLHAPRRLRIS